MSEKIKTAVMEVIKAHMDGEDKNTKAVLSDVMESVRETLEQEPCDECRNKRTSFCGNCNEYDEFEQEPCDDAISRDAVCDALLDYWHDIQFVDGSGYDVYEDCKAVIDELPSANTQPLEHYIDGVHAMGYREGYKDAQKQKSETVTEFADRCRECGARYGKLLKQKSGKWIMTGEVDVYYDLPSYECSKCGHTSLENGDYCPNCGCRMVEPQESEDKE